METFQTCQILRLNFPPKILFLTSCCMEKQTGSSVRWSLLLFRRTNCKLIVSEAFPWISLILGLRQTLCLYRFSRFRKAWRVTDSKVRWQDFEMSISPKGFSLVLKTLAVLSDQKNSPSIAGGEAVFLQLLACKRDSWGKTLEVVSICRNLM